MQLGVFIPIGNNGWLISTTSPQYKPSFDLNREVTQRAERHGFDFALSMIKLRGFGGKRCFRTDRGFGSGLLGALAGFFRPGQVDFLRPFRCIGQDNYMVRPDFHKAP